MEITLNINAPGLEQALYALAAALSSGTTISVGIPHTEFAASAPRAHTETAATTPTEKPIQYQTEPQSGVTPLPSLAPQVAQAPVQQPPMAPPAQPPQPVQPSAVPTTAPSYTMEQLAVAATQLVDAGRRDELLGLLSSFGVQALTALAKEQYGNFATQLRAMGARI